MQVISIKVRTVDNGPDNVFRIISINFAVRMKNFNIFLYFIYFLAKKWFKKREFPYLRSVKLQLAITAVLLKTEQ